MLRLFVALPVPDLIGEQIVRLQNGLEGAKWSPRDNFHITLRFIGDVDEPTARDIDAALAQVAASPFEINLKGAGHFGGDKPHAAWLGLAENLSLLALQKKCERACRAAGQPESPRAFTPHLTLAYLPRHQMLLPVLAFQQQLTLFASQSWTADRFYLYSSATSGPGPSRYQIEAEYPLIKLN